MQRSQCSCGMRSHSRGQRKIPSKLIDSLVYDDGTGKQVTEALVLPAEENRDRAHQVHSGQLIDKAQQIPCERFEEGYLPSAALDRANLHDAFARCLAVLECFEKREVSPVQEEVD